MADGIVFKDLSKKYEAVIIPESSGELPAGTVCVMGPSGCGKTTFARLIAGLEKPDSGSVEGVEGNVSFLFQDSRLFPSYTALRNVTCVSKKRGADSEKRALEILESLGLSSEDADKLPAELSGGMIRRTAIARLIYFYECFGGNTVILDEPFTGLDGDTKKRTADVLKKTLDGANVIAITHDAEDAELLGGKIVNFTEIFRKS